MLISVHISQDTSAQFRKVICELEGFVSPTEQNSQLRVSRVDFQFLRFCSRPAPACIQIHFAFLEEVVMMQEGFFGEVQATLESDGLTLVALPTFASEGVDVFNIALLRVQK